MIDAGKLVNIVPRVIGGGGSSLAFNGLILTDSPLIPAGQVTQWSGPSAVGTFFGMGSREERLAAVYFGGFDNSNRKPNLLFIARMVLTPCPAWLRGGVNAKTLADFQAVSNGGLVISMDGQAVSLAGVDFSGVTSFSEAAAALQSALEGAGGTAEVSYDGRLKTFLITSGISGADSSIDCAGAPESGQGLQDLAAFMGLSEQAGAVLSQGSEARTPGQTMQAIAGITRNWVLFTTTWEPDLDDKLAFARWVNDYGKVRYGYVGWDTDPRAMNPMSQASFGARLKEADLAGTAPVFDTPELAAFILGTAASIDFNERNGRITFAFKSLSGLAVTCDDPDIYDALLGHGYGCYADFHTANDVFRFFQNGQVSGDYKWLDSYCDAVAINNDLQLAIMNLFSLAKGLPYAQPGYDQVIAACLDPITKYLNFGAIVPGVPLSAVQSSVVNTEAGLNIATTLEQAGWYLQILPATAQVRAGRESPPCKLWWMDGGSIQKLDMSSTAIL